MVRFAMNLTMIIRSFGPCLFGLNKTRVRAIALSKIWITCNKIIFRLLNGDEETPEEKLNTTIKRCLLCIQQEQYDKAEKMLHLALRMAQEMQSKDGVTYIYDVMANLAMDREQFKKAEKLFVDVMRILLGNGVSEESPKVLHISSKLAHIAQLQGDIEKSRIGFNWTLAKIEECRKKMPDDIDVKELWGLTKNWFGQLLMQENNFQQAKQCFEDAYNCFVEIHGTKNVEAITILNNLGVACTNIEHFDDAKRYILKGLELQKNIKDASQEGLLLANLGIIYLRKGLIKEAKESCTQAWKTGKSHNNDAATKQAEYCLDKIKLHLQE